MNLKANIDTMQLLLIKAILALMAISGSSLVKAFDIDDFISKNFALYVGQKHESPKGVPEAFKEYAMRDKSNDDIGRASCEEIIKRSGFDYEVLPVVSDDGYVTNLLRLINPLAERSKLRQPPVMLLQGGITSTQIWIWGSSKQHHPEKYPREPEDGPITSWNRSLPFMLANAGYDVILTPYRGSNDQNQGHIKLNDKRKISSKLGKARRVVDEELDQDSNGIASTAKSKRRTLTGMVKYWDFTFDEMAAYELPRQMDKVLEVTGAEKLTLVPMSFSTIYTLMALSLSPRHQRKIVGQK